MLEVDDRIESLMGATITTSTTTMANEKAKLPIKLSVMWKRAKIATRARASKEIFSKNKKTSREMGQKTNTQQIQPYSVQTIWVWDDGMCAKLGKNK